MLAFPPDITFVIQIASFVVLWFGLKRLLFDPFQHLLETREARTSGTLQAAMHTREAANQAAQDYEQRLQAVRQTVAGEAAKARAATQTAEREILAAAREETSTQLTQLRDRLNQEAAAARPALATEARDLAGRMFERVVGRPFA